MISQILNGITDFSTEIEKRKIRFRKMLSNTLDRHSIRVTSYNTERRGVCGEVKTLLKPAYDWGRGEFYVRGRVSSVNLSKADKSIWDYKIKTEFHELFHANRHWLKTDEGFIIDEEIVSMPGWNLIEELFAELSAIYLVKAMGLSDRLFIPAYAAEIMRIIPVLKEMPEFSGAKTLYDLGERVVKFRFDKNFKTAQWAKYIDYASAKHLDIDSYIKQYRDELIEYRDVFLKEAENGTDSGFLQSSSYSDCYTRSYLRQIKNCNFVGMDCSKQRLAAMINIAYLMNSVGIK